MSQDERAPPAATSDVEPTVAVRQNGGAKADPVAWLIALATFGAYDLLSVFKDLRLAPGSWDLGIFTEYVRQIAHLHAPVVAIRGAGFNLLGDHFQPVVGLIAPFFRVFPSPQTLLVAQALLTAISVIPVCRAARELLGLWPSRAIGLAYGFSWGLQQMVNFDFHEIAFAVPLLAFSLSALVRRKLRPAVLWALPLVFVKEDQGFTVAAIGLLMVGMGLYRMRAVASPGGRPPWTPRWPKGPRDSVTGTLAADPRGRQARAARDARADAAATRAVMRRRSVLTSGCHCTASTNGSPSAPSSTASTTPSCAQAVATRPSPSASTAW